VGNQLTSPGGARSRVYYAKAIKGGTDTVTVNLSANSAWIELYLAEYSGVDQVNPVDTQAGASGNAGAVSSGNAATTVAGDVIFGYCVGDFACTAGSGFAARSTFNHNLIEDMLAAALARMPPKVRRTTVGTCRWSHSSLRAPVRQCLRSRAERGERDSRQFILVPDRRPLTTQPVSGRAACRRIVD